MRGFLQYMFRHHRTESDKDVCLANVGINF